MSVYQYYEFQAIDRPLTGKEMAELRACSTRAQITPTSFVNDYSWGNFKGDEDAWMEKYFDAFLHLANWGTHVFKLRLPARLLNLRTARPYCRGDRAAAREKNGMVILTFLSEDEEGSEWVEGESHLSSLISVRAELARGDLRSLYLGWLLCAQRGDLDDDEIEPPVPAGLAQLSASLESLVEFLRIETDLVAAAAAASAPLVQLEPKAAEVTEWLARLPLAERDALLARLIAGNDGALANELAQRVRRERGGDPGKGELVVIRRTVAELLAVAEQASGERRRIAAEKAAKEKARRERDAARARAKHLDRLAGKEPKLWKKVDGLIATKLPKSYDQAVEVLVELRDLAAGKDGADFRSRIEELRATHARKPSLLDRLGKARM